ncbi:lanthionine synthetase C family protein [Streptomyces flavofungini]|uniref:lanthionine synthetase C family protein n=1 Tax=Streptomyces flavofungini TaxID=68200 RepID=UPI0025B12E52|nr:lanthionine synthetase C family protein [Streptomyces flavofungini]WJV48891.1 lanthionine synthetase C family protein [Streptomyces flavofungini]
MSDLVHDLGKGLAGTALHEGVLARDSGKWDAAHQIAKKMAGQPATVNEADASLYRGAPAVAYALHAAGHPAYQTALDTLDERIAPLIDARVTGALHRMDTGTPPRMQEYDLISGLTGLGAYLLHRGTRPDLLHGVLGYLVRLIEQPVTVHGIRMPGWWTTDSPTGRPAEDWPGGHGNFGMAHGVSGPIALLALCARAGYHVPGHHQALQQACQLLTDWARPAPGSACWPETLTLEAWLAGPPARAYSGRASWCYGAPGIARSLQLAALASDEAPAQRRAEDALASCAADPEQLARLTDATVCHGWAGLSLALDRAAADAGPDSTLHRCRRTAHEALAAHADQDTPPRTAGLLTGADGILLSLHTLTPSRRVGPGRWDTCLLLG